MRSSHSRPFHPNLVERQTKHSCRHGKHPHEWFSTGNWCPTTNLPTHRHPSDWPTRSSFFAVVIRSTWKIENTLCPGHEAAQTMSAADRDSPEKSVAQAPSRL